MTTCVVVVGGEPTTQLLPPGLPPRAADRSPGDRSHPQAIWIAADSGLDLAHRLGHRVDVVVGDLDSVSPGALAAASEYGALVERHPRDKDETDLELALSTAVGRGADRIVVLGGAGGRLDHLLANVGALTAGSLVGVEVEAWIGLSLLRVVRDRATLHGAPGMIVSLEPWHGAVDGVTTGGLRWPLVGEALAPGETRGVSNEFEAAMATVSITSGVLLAVIPDASAIAGVRRVGVADGIDRLGPTPVPGSAVTR